ncbi:hypothetical protein Csa_021719 [Cucumis sativus]|nr:hypothetical protein Csa_021719 [Cucumis sativus]
MGPVRGERKGESSHFSPQPPNIIMKEGYGGNFHLTVIALSIPLRGLPQTDGRFPVALASSQCAKPQRGRC